MYTSNVCNICGGVGAAQPPLHLAHSIFATSVAPFISAPKPVFATAGSSGTIYRIARVGNFYGVLFDGEAMIRVMHHSYPERAILQERTVGMPDT